MSEPSMETNGKAIQIAVLDTRLSGIETILTRLEAKFDGMVQWRSETEAQLARGSERFRAHEEVMKSLVHEMDGLRGRDTMMTVLGGVYATTVSAIAAGIVAAFRRQP